MIRFEAKPVRAKIKLESKEVEVFYEVALWDDDRFLASKVVTRFNSIDDIKNEASLIKESVESIFDEAKEKITQCLGDIKIRVDENSFREFLAREWDEIPKP